MQIFKDKQLRIEFQQFKRDVLKKVKKLEQENSTLQNENTLLRQKLIAHENEFNHSSLKPTKSNDKSPKKETTLVFGGNTLNKDSQILYKSLSFDGFWFKNTRGKASNKKLCNIHQIIFLKGLKSEKKISWTELSNSFDVSPRVLQRIAFNILKGTFDKYIKEYHKTKFSLKKGKFYINNRYTKLSKLNVCEIVLSYVDNPSEKTLNKLIKSYPNINPEDIITICDNYDSVPLKKQSIPIHLENNPQKRKEKGMS